MKGQPLMKHSPDLIGSIVQVFRTDWKFPRLPRAGLIVGFHEDEGLFEVMLFHNYAIDQRQGGLPALGIKGRVLLVDDPDDIPVGVSDYAVLHNDVRASSPLRLASELIIGGDGEKPQDTQDHVPEPEKKATQNKPKATKKAPPKKKPQSKKAPSKKKAPPPKADEHEKIHKEQGTKTRPAGETPAQIMLNSREFEPIHLIDGATAIETGAKEISIEREGEDRPIAKLLYVSASTGHGDPGWTIKTRDQTGRCTVKLGSGMASPAQVAPSLECLHNCVHLAMQADPGDYTSAAGNMQAAINQFRGE